MKIIRSLTLFAALLIPSLAMASDSAESCSCCDHCPAGCPCCNH